MAPRLLGFGEIDHGAGLDAAGAGVADAEDLDGVRAPAQRLLRHARLQPSDQAGDLAGADVEHGNERRALERQRLHLGGNAMTERVHALPPLPFGFLILSASSRACAAVSDRRTVTRSWRRRSTAVMSRVRSFLSRSSAASASSACGTSASGNRMSMPFWSLRFQRRSPTRIAARTFGRNAG